MDGLIEKGHGSRQQRVHMIQNPERGLLDRPRCQGVCRYVDDARFQMQRRQPDDVGQIHAHKWPASRDIKEVNRSERLEHLLDFLKLQVIPGKLRLFPVNPSDITDPA
jgi:hypothetical protein